MSNVKATLRQRGKTHGDFPNTAKSEQELRDWLRSQLNWDSLTYSERCALDMIVHKIARIMNGNPHFADHWHDIAGYAVLVEKECATDN